MNNNIEKYYENIKEGIINECLNNNNLKNLLELSTKTDLYVFTKKKKDNWILKDKRVLLKECHFKRNQKLKEVKTNVNILNKHKSVNLNNTHNLLNDIEEIDNLITTIESTFPENNLLGGGYIETFSN
jgi:hypothetical protein